MAELSISEVAQRAGLRPSALRYYEEIGLLTPTRRIGGRRHYDESVLEKLAVIQTAQQAGFTLAELRILLNDVLDAASPSTRWHDLIQRKLQEMNTLLQNVQNMKRLLEDIMDCDDASLAECIILTGQRHQLFHSAQ
ncbi:MAG TPA: MerR family transcriptional regulator [Oceanobacillus sp.]|nr:MerR family transcriptional regulator [Oceanobacillus sp.]